MSPWIIQFKNREVYHVNFDLTPNQNFKLEVDVVREDNMIWKPLIKWRGH